jgi:hypothetical protein
MLGARWSKFLAVVAIALTSAAWLATVAIAEGEEDTGGFGAFRLEGTNGYSILVVAFSEPHFKKGQVLVGVGNGKDSGVLYLAPASVTATTIDADLGAVGKLSLQFEPSAPVERVHPKCKRDGSFRFEPGVWVGTIEFEGEEGFTRVARSRSKAIPFPFLEDGCDTYSIGETFGHDAYGARLVLRSPARHRSLFLQVNENHRNAPVLVEASLEERRTGMIVDRELLERYPASSFAFGPLLRSATLAPPSPFAGSATFRRFAKPANRWTGDLTIDFPGRADVPLSGDGFKATLVAAKRTEENRHYARRSRNLAAVQVARKRSGVEGRVHQPVALLSICERKATPAISRSRRSRRGSMEWWRLCNCTRLVSTRARSRGG